MNFRFHSTNSTCGGLGVDRMENEEPEKVVLPMHPIALEVAREDMERLDALKREQDRIEEEREKEERGMDNGWIMKVFQRKKLQGKYA
jgi:hypothetical protein